MIRRTQNTVDPAAVSGPGAASASTPEVVPVSVPVAPPAPSPVVSPPGFMAQAVAAALSSAVSGALVVPVAADLPAVDTLAPAALPPGCCPCPHCGGAINVNSLRGSLKTPRKAKSSAENGKKGGRPKKVAAL